MGIETRGQREYYYRKRRVGGRVVSKYVGAGELAGRCAAWDALQRKDDQDARRRRQEALAAELQIDAAVDEAGDMITAMTEGCLLVHGFHVHNGEWRRSK